MEILALRIHGRGYRGCLIADGEYRVFQYSPRQGFKVLKTYPRSEFEDDLHFIAVMQKFMTPSAFIFPPAPIQALSVVELQRVEADRKK